MNPNALIEIAEGAFNDATADNDLSYQERILAFAEAQAAAQIATVRFLLQLAEQRKQADLGMMVELYNNLDIP
jgi:hypothetical protein